MKKVIGGISVVALAAILVAVSWNQRIKSVGTYTVQSDTDRFADESGSRKVQFDNWILRVDGKEIPIPHAKSIINLYQTGNHLKIVVNGTVVIED